MSAAVAIEKALGIVRRELGEVAESLRAEGMPVPEPEGKLLRPLLAYGFVPAHLRRRLDDQFWFGALAIQMAHEASLLHDDILDGATERRGSETLYSARGVGPALVLGDHYLTGAYRAAARTGSPEFMERFATAVERTVAGEVAQARAAGTRLDRRAYLDIVEGKSGELLGAAAFLGAVLLDLDRLDERLALGREIGGLYQQVDDLLDYCVAADRGKAPLQDYRQEKWTWILDVAGVHDFGLDELEVVDRIFAPGAEGIAADRALAELGARRTELSSRAEELGADELVGATLASWFSAAVDGVAAVAYSVAPPVAPGWTTELTDPGAAKPAAPSPETVVLAAARALGGPEQWGAYFGRHAKTFSLASRLFPPDAARKIRGLYAFCRLTDDLVDEPKDLADGPVLLERLNAWRRLSRAAFEGEITGVAVLDEVLGESGRAGVEWKYPKALLDGVEMDLTRNRYETFGELQEYTFGVAGSVGGWISQLFGIADPHVLERAHALGHGMQLTNILRDVGEDLERDRVYLPSKLLEAHGLTVDDLRALRASSEPLPPEYGALLEQLIGVAEAYYEHAQPGLVSLPGFFRRPVAAAAEAYRGIHVELRRNGYDNLRRRAHTSLTRKLALSAIGIFNARRESEGASSGMARYAT